MIERRPSVFIGSSAEGLSIAESLQLNLDRACEVVLWSQGVFGLGGGTLETLVDKAGEFDFAILVLTPDDIVESRGVAQQSPRDNVLLELGLFLGVLGRRRTFVVFERTTAMKLSSDLAGVTLADYQTHSTGNVDAYVGASCTLIKRAIVELGLRPRREPILDVDKNTHFQIICDLMDEAALQFLILMHEQSKVLQKESFVGLGPSYICVNLQRGTRSQGSFSVGKLCRGLPDAGLLQLDLSLQCLTYATGPPVRRVAGVARKQSRLFQNAARRLGR